MSRRATSVVRPLDSLAQQRHHVRTQHIGRSFNQAQCMRCAMPIFTKDGTRWEGPLLELVELVHSNKRQIFIRGVCGAKGHVGSREDVIRVDFDYDYDDDDMARAGRSCVFFPRGSDAGAA